MVLNLSLNQFLKPLNFINKQCAVVLTLAKVITAVCLFRIHYNLLFQLYLLLLTHFPRLNSLNKHCYLYAIQK